MPMTCNLHRTGLPALAVESMEQESNIGWLWVISVQVYSAGGWRWCLPLVWCWRWLLVHPALSAQGALLRRMSTQATWAKLWQTLQPPLYSVSSSRSTPAIFTSLSPYLNSATGRLVKRYISTLLIKNEANDFFFSWQKLRQSLWVWQWWLIWLIRNHGLSCVFNFNKTVLKVPVGAKSL